MDTPTSVRDLLFTLLLKVGVASSIAALLARWNTFRRVLFTEDRDLDLKVKLMLFLSLALFVCVMLRLDCGPARRSDPAGDSQQGRSLEFRAVNVLEYPESDHATVAKSGIVVGNGALGCVRGTGTGARGPGACD